jgi:hypothetical protein
MKEWEKVFHAKGNQENWGSLYKYQENHTLNQMVQKKTKNDCI